MKIINAYRALNAMLGENLLDNLAAIRAWLGPGTVGRHERGDHAHGKRGHDPRHAYGRVGSMTVASTLWLTKRADIIRERATQRLRAHAWGALIA